MLHRVVLVVGMILVAMLAGPQVADACVQADEVTRLVGWSADGPYGLFVDEDARGALVHAEIQPTTFQGSLDLIGGDEVGMKKVCNGGDLKRLIAATPREIKVPKGRCKGSGG